MTILPSGRGHFLAKYSDPPPIPTTYVWVLKSPEGDTLDLWHGQPDVQNSVRCSPAHLILPLAVCLDADTTSLLLQWRSPER